MLVFVPVSVAVPDPVLLLVLAPVPVIVPVDPPLPVIVEGEEEWEVEEILDSRRHRGRLQYLVRWKGYDVSHNSWESAGNVANAKKLVDTFHRKRPNAPRELSAAVFESLNFQPIPEPLTVASAKPWEMGIVAAHGVMSH